MNISINLLLNSYSHIRSEIEMRRIYVIRNLFRFSFHFELVNMIYLRACPVILNELLEFLPVRRIIDKIYKKILKDIFYKN